LNISDAKVIIKEAIFEALSTKLEIQDDTQLIGGSALLDSMKLVEVCIALEDIADESGFEFDWTSENAMSRSQSMFRTVTSLAEEFLRQSNSKS
jgi:acyl carrier protein